jgi:hypothetical protein
VVHTSGASTRAPRAAVIAALFLAIGSWLLIGKVPVHGQGDLGSGWSTTLLVGNGNGATTFPGATNDISSSDSQSFYAYAGDVVTGSAAFTCGNDSRDFRTSYDFAEVQILVGGSQLAVPFDTGIRVNSGDQYNRDWSYTIPSTGSYQVQAFVRRVGLDSSTYSPSKLVLTNVKWTHYDVPPISNPGGPYTVAEGGAVRLDGSGSFDPDAASGDSIQAYAWDLDGDGIFETTGLNPTFSAAGLDGPSRRTITLKVTDSHGEWSTSFTTLTITNAAPTVTPPSDQTARQGASASFDLGSFTDPGPDSPYSVGVNWGDGSPLVIQTATATGRLGALPHAYPLSGAYTVTIRVTDKDGAGGDGTFKVNVTDGVAPVTAADVSPQANAAGWHNQDVTVTLNATDLPNPGGSGVASIGYSVNGAPTTVNAATVKIPVTTEGVTTITYSATDIAGNTETPAHTLTLHLDKTAPTLKWSESTAPANAAGWNKTAVTISYTADDAGGSGVAFTAPPSPLAFTGEGANQTQTVTVTDVAGNSQTFTTRPVNIDTIPPAVAEDDLASTTWRNTDLAQVFHAADSGSGLTADSPAVVSLTAHDESTLDGQGVVHPTTVSQTWTDAAGNKTTRTVSALIDRTPPVVTPGTPQATAGNSGWFRSDVSVSLSASDTLSGLQGGAPANLVTTGEGAVVTTGTAAVYDKAGNKTVVGPLTFSVDKTPPVISGADINDATWHKGPVSQAFTADDGPAGSGLAPGNASFTLTASDESPNAAAPTTAGKTVTDVAGNSSTRTISVLIDKTLPVVKQLDTTGTLGNTDDSGTQWYLSDVKVNFSASDAPSGLKDSSDASFSRATSGEGKAVSTSSHVVLDQAGNAVTAGPLPFAVDKTAPDLSASPDRDPDNNDWYTKPVTVTFTGQDATSGVGSGTPPITYSGPDSDTASVQGSCADRAGNKTVQSFSFKYDATPPTVTVAGVSEGAYLKSAAVVIAAADPGRPNAALTVQASLDGTRVPVDASGFDVVTDGHHTLAVQAADEAGNTSRQTIQFTVDHTAPEILFDPAAPVDHGIYNSSQMLTYGLQDALDSSPFFTLQQLTSDLLSGDQGPLDITSPSPVSAEGQHQVQLQAQDHAGNQAQVTRRFLIDQTPPATAANPMGTPAPNPDWFQSPVSVSFSASDPDIRTPGVPGSGVAALDYTASGAQPVDPTEVNSASAGLNVTTEGVTTIRYFARDKAGNSENPHTLTVRFDKTPPALTVPDNFTQEATGPEGAAVSFKVAGTDNVDPDPTVTADHHSGDTFPVGTTVVTGTAKDQAGNVTQKSFGVTVQDTTPPAIQGVPAHVTVEATGPAGGTATFTPPTATDTVDGPVPVKLDHDSGAIFPLGDTTVNCTAADAHGNRAAVAFTVTVQDTTPPAIGAVPAPLKVEATDARGAVVTFTSPTATDQVDGTVPVICTPASGTVFPVGTTTVTGTATDAHKNQSITRFTVTVADTTPPVFSSVPDGIIAEATGPSGAKVSFSSPTAIDAVSGEATVTCTPASGSTFPLGTTRVDCVAKDDAGNPAAASFPVTVQDTTPPKISVPADIVVEAASSAGAPASFTVQASDLVDGSEAVTTSVASGSVFPLGTTTVTCTSTDRAGNKGTGSFTVTVRDTTAPVLNLPKSVSATATSATGAAVSYTATAADAVDGPDAVSGSPASGATFPLGTTTVNCRSTDKAGNTTTGSFPVSVTYSWSNVLQPVNADGSSVFKQGSTVPVRFQLTGGSAGVTNAVAKLYVARVSNSAVGAVNEAVSTSATDSGNLFRYDPTSGQYLFNLSTKSLTAGTYQLKIDLGDGVDRAVNLGLR